MLGGLSHVPPPLQTGHRVGTRAASPQCATGMGGDTREHPLAPSSAAEPGLEISSGGWRRCRGGVSPAHPTHGGSFRQRGRGGGEKVFGVSELDEAGRQRRPRRARGRVGSSPASPGAGAWPALLPLPSSRPPSWQGCCSREGSPEGEQKWGGGCPQLPRR